LQKGGVIMLAHIFFLALLIFAQLPLQGSCTLDNGKGEPSEALLTLLTAYGIQHNGSWDSIQKETEKAWLSHGRNRELWEIAPVQDIAPGQSFALFSALGMTDTISARQSSYDYGVVLGALLQSVRQRFWFLKQEWDRGVRFSELIILTGDRPLDTQFEGEKELLDQACSPYPFRSGWTWNAPIPTNETEMMQLVFDQLDLPEAWRSMPVLFVDAPKPDGLRRPHTEHTLLYWLAAKPKPGSLLMVSNQPFVCRQGELLRLYLPQEFSLEAVGICLPFETYVKEKRAAAVLLTQLAYRIKIYTGRAERCPHYASAFTRASSPSSFLSSAPCLCDK
jgi:hypothetical protein